MGVDLAGKSFVDALVALEVQANQGIVVHKLLHDELALKPVDLVEAHVKMNEVFVFAHARAPGGAYLTLFHGLDAH